MGRSSFCMGWALARSGLPAFRRDVISVHPLGRIVSGARVPSMGKVGWEAGAAAVSPRASSAPPKDAELQLGQCGLESDPVSRYARMRAYRYHDCRPSSCRRTASTSIRRGATWGVAVVYGPRTCTFWGEKGGSVKRKSSTLTTARRARGTGIKKQQRQEAAQERHMASRGKE